MTQKTRRSTFWDIFLGFELGELISSLCELIGDIFS